MYFTLKSLQSIITASSIASNYYIMIENPREGTKFDIIDDICAMDWNVIRGYDTLKAKVKSRLISKTERMENYILLSNPDKEDGSIIDPGNRKIFIYDLVNLIGINLGIMKPGYYGKIKVGLQDASKDETIFSFNTVVSDLRVFANMRVQNIDISEPGIKIYAYPWWLSKE